MRNRTIVALAVGHLVAAALAALLYFRVRVDITRAFRAEAATLPPLTAVALSPLFLPLAVGAGLALAGIGAFAPLKRSQRLRIIAAGLIVSAGALVFAVWAAFAPLFRAGAP